MRLEFHKLVASDISRIMDYYDDAAGPQLSDDFYNELRLFFIRAAESPESYAIRERDLRRVNLERFPYHFLFRIAGSALRILVVRHHSRRPSLGVHRRLSLSPAKRPLILTLTRSLPLPVLTPFSIAYPALKCWAIIKHRYADKDSSARTWMIF